MVFPEAAVATRGHRSWAWAGLATVALIAAIDAVTRGEVVFITAVVIGPFIAAIGATSAVVALVACVATVVAVVLGLPNDIFLSGDHIIRVGVVAAGGALAVVVTRIREERDAQLRVVGPEAQRLRLALAAGGMGTWRWDLSAGRIVWDAAQEELFGLQPGTFDGSFDTYAGLLHPEDRDTALAAVRYGMERGTSWQFEHRVVWPDGSVHWLEGRGEPVRDAGGIVGATGISIDIDARRFLESRRGALLEAEQRAREAAEQSSGALGRLAVLTAALSAAATVDDVAVTMVHHVNDALEAGFGWFGLVDNATDTIVTRAQEGYPSSSLQPFDTVPLSVSIPATEVLQTREAIFVESPEDRANRYPHIRAPEVHGAFVVVPVSPDDETAGVLSFGFSEPRQFSNEDRQYISAVVEAFSHALRRAALYEAEQTSRGRLRTLLDFSELLTGLDDPDAVLQATSQFAATRIGRVASVYAHEIDGTLRRASVAHADPELGRAMRALLMQPFDAPEVVRKVAQTRVGVLEQDTSRAPIAPDARPDREGLQKAIAATSGLVVPIQVSGRSLGVLVVGTDRPAPLTAADLELATDLGRRSASALERAQLWRASQEQLAAEHRIVEVLQRSIVPDRLPRVPGTQLAAQYRAADVFVDVGGDWYDAFDVDTCPLLLMVGDVAGHGLEAATLMGRVRNALRAYAVEDSDPAAMLRRAHDMLYTLEPGSMVTAVVACYSPETRAVLWSRAGHPPPIVCDERGWRMLEDVNATPLGTTGHNFATAETKLEPGALLVLYTDGLIERRHHGIDEGLAWLGDRVNALRDEPVEDICRVLVEETTVARRAQDDICVLVMRAT